MTSEEIQRKLDELEVNRQMMAERLAAHDAAAASALEVIHSSVLSMQNVVKELEVANGKKSRRNFARN